MKKVIPAVAEKISSITCDSCLTTYDCSDIFQQLEAQEFMSYQSTGGYANTVFGDGEHWSVDLCQYCTGKLLGQIVQRKGNTIHSTGQFEPKVLSYEDEEESHLYDEL